MKHIYLINNVSQASLYGIGAYIRQIKGILKECFEKVTILTLNSQGEEIKIEETGGIRCIEIPSGMLWAGEKTKTRYYKYLSFLLSLYIDKAEVNIFQFNYLHQKPLAGFLRDQYPGCCIVVVVHYFTWLMELKGNMNKLRIMQRKLEVERTTAERGMLSTISEDQEFLKEADKVICLAEYTRRLLKEEMGIPPDKIHLIPNGLGNPTRCLTKSECRKKKKKLYFQDSDKIILFTGRLDVLKGVPELIEAFKIVLKQIPEAKLVVVGNGDYDICFQKAEKIWSRVTFTGRISQEILYDLYQIADIGVLPSLNEQCSYVAIEMMMCGLPFIGTTTTGLKEMLDNRQDWLVSLKENDCDVILPVKELARKMIDLLLEAQRKMDYEVYEKRYSLECMKENMFRFYHAI